MLVTTNVNRLLSNAFDFKR